MSNWRLLCWWGLVPVTLLFGQDEPPVRSRLQIWPTGQSFEIRGYRGTSVGGQDRLSITTGMTIKDLREAVATSTWSSTSDRLDRPGELRLDLARSRPAAPEERIVVEVTAPGERGRVRRIIYSVGPVIYSTEGLKQQLEAALGEGVVLTDRSDLVELAYAPRDGSVTMEVQATRAGRAPEWFIRYDWVDANLPRLPPTPTTSRPSTAPSADGSDAP